MKFWTRSSSSESNGSGHPYHDLPLLLVSGMGRSGTTLLRHCVAAHSRIACHNAESNYLFDLARAASENAQHPNRLSAIPRSKADFWRLHREMVLQLLWPPKQLKKKPLPSAIATYTMLDPRAAIGLGLMFPEMQILYIVRNGIEVVSSYQAFKSFEHLSFEDVCRLWATCEKMVRFCEKRTHAHLLRFEWTRTASEFETEFRRTLKQCGLDTEAACLQPLSKNFHPTRLEGESRDAAKDREQRKHRWKWWTPEQRELFLRHCKPLMDKLDYPIPW